MAQVTINWTPNPSLEQVTSYNVYVDGTLVGNVSTTPFVTDLVPGPHTIEVAPVNIWGQGPLSDPIATPPAATKTTGVSISITVNVTV